MTNNEINSSVLSSLGILLIFAMLLPGILGYGLTVALFGESEKFSEPLVYAGSIIFTIGFISNFFGHFLGIVYRRILLNINYPFDIFKFSYRLPEEIATRIRRDVDYWFSYYCWYWNSAMAIFLVLSGKVYFAIVESDKYGFTQFELIISVLIILTALLLLVTANKLLKDMQSLMDNVLDLDIEKKE